MHVCEAIRALRPTSADHDAIAALVGDATVDSLPGVAAAFGVAHNTVKQSWRPAGMPGSGTYNLSEVLAWRIEYDARLRGYGNEPPLDVKTVEERLDEAIERRLGRFERGLRKAVAK
jgi:hypothetical protein